MLKNLISRKIIINGLISTIICGIIACLLYYYTTEILVNNTQKSLTEISAQGSHIVQKELETQLEILKTLANDEELKDPTLSPEKKVEVLRRESRIQDYKRISISDIKGNSYTSDYNKVFIGDRDYFKAALSGKSVISGPLKSKIDAGPVVAFATPVYNQEKIIAVLYITQDIEFLSEISDTITFGKTGNAFIINKDGTFIAHSDRNFVLNGKNIYDLETDGQNRKNIEFFRKLVNKGEPGAIEFNLQNNLNYMGFSPISGTQWYLGVTALKSDIFSDIDKVIKTFIIVASLALLLLISVNIYSEMLKNRLEKEHQLSLKAIDTAGIIILSFDSMLKIKKFNKYAEIKTGYSAHEVIDNKDLRDIVYKYHDKENYRIIKAIIRGEKPENFELALLSKDGTPRYIMWNIYENMYEDQKGLNEIMGIDITDRVLNEKALIKSHEELSATEEELRVQFDELLKNQEELRKSEERYMLATEGCNDIIWEYDIINNNIYMSDRFYENLGFKKVDNFTLKNWISIIHPEDIDNAKRTIRSCLKGEKEFYFTEFRMRDNSGSYKWFLCRGKGLINSDNKVVKIAGSLTDITESKKYEQKIYNMAYYDSLTGLPNRSKLFETLERELAFNKDKRFIGALMFIDIDNFKTINDSYGHSIGDKLLMEIALRLSQLEFENKMVSRLSGDEFIVLFTRQENLKNIELLAANAINELCKPVYLDDKCFHISVSIGVAVFPDHGNDTEVLLKNADTAMYRAKEKGKNQYVFFDKKMSNNMRELLELENDLRSAIIKNEFVLVYQPQLRLRNNKISGFEALLRWVSPKYGLVTPEKFIKTAEDTGLIIPIGICVMQEACNFAVKLNRLGFIDFCITINVSTIQLLQQDFVDSFLNAIKTSGVHPGCIGIEITETSMMENFDINIEKLNSLKSIGVKIYLDDFGKGYSSLNYLKRLPIETLKIDKSFVDDISDNKSESSIIGSIISLAHEIGLSVVAEGIENKEQLEILNQSGCDIVQGYFISRPLSEAQAYEYYINQ